MQDLAEILAGWINRKRDFRALFCTDPKELSVYYQGGWVMSISCEGAVATTPSGLEFDFHEPDAFEKFDKCLEMRCRVGESVKKFIDEHIEYRWMKICKTTN